MFHRTAPTLTGTNVVLRHYKATDLDRLTEFYQSPRTAYVGGPQTRDKVWREIGYDAGLWSLLGYGTWAIDERATGEFAGAVALNHPTEYPETELGWILFEPFEGKGYALEAASLARDFAFQVLGLKTFVSYIDPDNIRSIRLAQRLGAVRDPHAGTPHDEPCLVYRHAR